MTTKHTQYSKEFNYGYYVEKINHWDNGTIKSVTFQPEHIELMLGDHEDEILKNSAYADIVAALIMVNNSGPLNNGLRDDATMQMVKDVIAKIEQVS